MKQNFIFSTIKVTVIDILLDIIHFPVWWYSSGFIKTLKVCGLSIQNSYHDSAIGILLRNMFKPMYGEYSFTGRVISFFARIFILLFKLIQLVIWIVVLLATLLLWLGLPIIAIYQIINYGIPR
ncbi:MAG: hypothetical protein WCX88_00805 [Patescibacteria group bacterium]